jgi:hypothetical protein
MMSASPNRLRLHLRPHTPSNSTETLPSLPPPPRSSCHRTPGLFRNLWLKYNVRRLSQFCRTHRWLPCGQPFQYGHMFWSKLGRLYLITIGADRNMAGSPATQAEGRDAAQELRSKCSARLSWPCVVWRPGVPTGYPRSDWLRPADERGLRTG